MTTVAKIESICISKAKGERKNPVANAVFIENHGIEGDAHAGEWHRQISLLSDEDIATIRNKGLPDLKPGDFAENIAVSGINLSELGLGSLIRLGPDVEITLTQIGKDCHSPCAIYNQTGDCIMPRQGVFARIIKGGSVQVNEEVTILKAVPRKAFQCVVLTISDRCSRNEAEDTAGPAVAARLQNVLNGHIYAQEIIPDDQEEIASRLEHYCDGHSIDIVCAVGGTGFSPRDVTPEAVSSIVERPTPGLDEAMRSASMQKTKHAMLSRSVSGICKTTLIISLPGSERAAVENIDVVLPALNHGLEKLRGDQSDCARLTEKPEKD